MTTESPTTCGAAVRSSDLLDGKSQQSLFESVPEWRKEWEGMPEFVQEDLTSFRRIVVHFKNQQDVDAFAKLIGQKIGKKQPSLWFPPIELMRCADKKYVNES